MRAGVKSRSRWSRNRWVAPALALLATAGAEGCNRGHANGTPPPSEVLEVDITPEATLVAEPGEGVGVFVETYDDGSWHVVFACDTNTSGYSCDFAGSVTSSAGLSGLQAETTEADDFVDQDDPRSASFDLRTTTDFDGLWFDATPGASMTLEVTLDGHSAPEFVFWMGGGVLHKGAPSNPVRFLPE